jgi:hypothetical protein
MPGRRFHVNFQQVDPLDESAGDHKRMKEIELIVAVVGHPHALTVQTDRPHVIAGDKLTVQIRRFRTKVSKVKTGLERVCDVACKQRLVPGCSLSLPVSAVDKHAVIGHLPCPGVEVCSRLEIAKILLECQKCLLQDVLGVVRVAQQRHQVRTDSPFAIPVECEKLSVFSSGDKSIANMAPIPTLRG